MENKHNRDEVWERNKPYMTKEYIKETAEDLLPICQKCEKWTGEDHDFETCRGCQVMELWLSNEFLEWYMSWV